MGHIKKIFYYLGEKCFKQNNKPVNNNHLWCTFVCVPYAAKALQSGQEARIVQIDFSAAFDWVNHQGILYESIGSALWVFEVLCCLYWHSFCQTDRSMLWWMAVGVNWLMLFQECRRAVFWASYCTFCTFQIIFLFWKIIWSIMLMTTLMAVVLSPGIRVTVVVSDPWPWQG